LVPVGRAEGAQPKQNARAVDIRCGRAGQTSAARRDGRAGPEGRECGVVDRKKNGPLDLSDPKFAKDSGCNGTISAAAFYCPSPNLPKPNYNCLGDAATAWGGFGGPQGQGAGGGREEKALSPHRCVGPQPSGLARGGGNI